MDDQQRDDRQPVQLHYADTPTRPWTRLDYADLIVRVILLSHPAERRDGLHSATSLHAIVVRRRIHDRPAPASRKMAGMPETTPNATLEELSGSTDVGERALARYRADPTTDNLANCVRSYANATATRIGHLTDRLAAAEAEIKVLKGAAARAERPRLRASSPGIPTAPQGGG
jgi:hypothetical protein